MRSHLIFAPHLLRRALAVVVLAAAGAAAAHGFCGFYVARADAHLYNHASQVVLVREGERTVLTMANDFKGDVKEFAIVVPVPTVLERGQIHVAERALIDHVDAFSAPRLTEYFDADPCQRLPRSPASAIQPGMAAPMQKNARLRAEDLGVKIEAKYTVGEYDILILSAAQSSGLMTWLTANGYKVPAGAARVLGSYIGQGLHFFVAKVNLGEQQKLGFANLRPIQMAYESRRFMLPIRLGMVNASGPQDLLVYALTHRGRVETTNYRTVKLASGEDVPLFVKNDFGRFHTALFDRQVAQEDGRAVFLEYAWNMGWCDPCAADPLSQEELRNLGVFWLDGGAEPAAAKPGFAGRPRRGSADVFLSRLHVRYDAEHFPEDLAFQETGDSESFQSLFALHHPWQGSAVCDEAAAYRRDVRQRYEREARNLASLTGWDINSIRAQMNLQVDGAAPATGPSWWDKLWNQ